MKKVTIYTDGGCEGNPGPGAWAAILGHDTHEKELSGGEPATTNNRMELRAAIEGLRALKEPCRVEFFTDSEYLRDGITNWLPKWKVRGWRTTGKKPVKNEDLWRALDEQAEKHEIQWNWVKGHAGNPFNERCDRLANQEIASLKTKFKPDELKALLAEFVDESRKTDQLSLF